jgi:hypothetical protein
VGDGQGRSGAGIDPLVARVERRYDYGQLLACGQVIENRPGRAPGHLARRRDQIAIPTAIATR